MEMSLLKIWNMEGVVVEELPLLALLTLPLLVGLRLRWCRRVGVAPLPLFSNPPSLVASSQFTG